MNTLPMTVGELKQRNGLAHVPVREEIRKHLYAALLRGEDPFASFPMFTHSVIPELARGLLAGHNIMMLGLRGQGKSTLLRELAMFLDPYAPRLVGTPLPEHPGAPISPLGKQLARHPDTEITWVNPAQRVLEYIAVPDLTVADMFGEADPFRAQRLGTDLSDPRALQFGMVGAANHGLLIVNELPDLTPKVQVALFDLLQEGTIQPAGANGSYNIDTLVLFTANPEDYTQRGRIVTPLRDRIGSQIESHYAADWRVSRDLTHRALGVGLTEAVKLIPPLQREYLERLVFVARDSMYSEERSGVSQRLPIAALELVCTEMRLRAASGKTSEQIVVPYQALDLIDPAIMGRIELTFDGEELGRKAVAERIRRDTYIAVVADYVHEEALHSVTEFFETGGTITLNPAMSYEQWLAQLEQVPGLLEQGRTLPHRTEVDIVSNAEFLLEALVAVGVLTRAQAVYQTTHDAPQEPEGLDSYALN